MPRKKIRRKHSARAELRIPALTKAGSSLTLEVYAESRKVGQLVVGRGGLFWRGGGRKLSKRLTWSRFAEKMNELAYGEERTGPAESR